MTLIYIASAYSIGSQAANVRTQIDAAEQLMQKGFCPIVPLLSHFQEMIYPHSWGWWIEQDKAKILKCDAVLRLPGKSEGADIECSFATRNIIPVFETIEKLEEYFK